MKFHIGAGVVLVLLPAALNGGGDTTQKSSGFCSPNIQSPGGDLDIKMECFLVNSEKRDISASSIEVAISHLSHLTNKQAFYFLPSAQAYVNEPSPQKWQLVLQEVSETNELIHAAKNAVLSYVSTLPPSEAKRFKEVHGLLQERSVALLFFMDDVGHPRMNMPQPNDLQQWMWDYGELLNHLQIELERVYEAVQVTQQG